MLKMSSRNIKVVIKARPLLKKEQENKLTSQWIIQNNSIRSTDTSGERYCFDHVFDENVSNRDIFNTIAKPIVDSALEGFNGTIFTYGQTSSGKTYTMLGDENNPGLIALTAMEIFKGIDLLLDRKFLLRVGYIEIYNEKVFDLLNISTQDLKIHDIGNGDVGVHCVEHIVTSTENIMQHLQAGNKFRKRGETNMNELSSRSHAIFRITIESREVDKPPDEAVQKSIITLVDLAGSERADQTGATGNRLKEGAHINKSLFTLTLVINKLSEAEKFVNFRDSKLTRILQTSLTGNALISIICNINPTALEETTSTLSFATRAKVIKIKPKVNEILSDVAMMKRLETKIARLESELKKEKDKNCEKAIEMIEELHKEEEKIIHSQNSNHNKQRILRRRTWSACVNSEVTANVGKAEENLPNEFMMPCSKLMTPLITYRDRSYERLPILDELPNIEEFSFTDSQIPVKTPEVFKNTRSSFNTSIQDHQKQFRQLETELEELKAFTQLEQKFEVEHDYLNSLKVQLTEAQEKIKELEKEKIQRLQSELLEQNQANQRILDLESQLRKNRKEYEEISAEFMDHLHDSEDTRMENISLKEKIKEMEAKLDSKDTKKNNASAANGVFKQCPFVDYRDKKDFNETAKVLEKTILTVEQELLIYKNENKILKNRISDLEKEKNLKPNYNNVIKSQQLLSEKSNNLYKEVNVKFSDLNVIIEQFAGKVEKIEERWDECKNYFKGYSSDIEALTKKLRIAAEQNNKLENLNIDMEQKLFALTAENDNLKSQLQKQTPQTFNTDQTYLSLADEFLMSSSNALESGKMLLTSDKSNQISIKESHNNITESKEIESLKLVVKELEEKVVKYTNDLKELKSKYEKVNFENKDLQIICDGLKSRLRALEKVNEEISSAAEELEKELETSNGKYTALFEEKSALEEKYNEMNKEQCELRLQLEQQIVNSSKVESDEHSLQVMKKQIEKENQELLQECSDLKLKISNKTKENLNLLEKLKEFANGESSVEKEDKISKQRLEELSKECCAITKHLERNTKHNNELQGEIIILNQMNEENTAKLNAMEKENRELKKLLEESNSLINHAEKEYEKLKLSIVSLDGNSEKRDEETTEKEKNMEQTINKLLDSIEEKNEEITQMKSNNAAIISKLENLNHEISQYQEKLNIEVNKNVALKKDIENLLGKNSTLELERQEFKQKIQELVDTAANKEASLVKQIHETNKMHVYKTKQLENEIDLLKAKSSSTYSELVPDKNLKSESSRNQRESSSQNIQKKDQIIRCLLGDNKKLRTQNTKLSQELEDARKVSKQDRKSRRLSMHDEKRETLYQARKDIGTMTMSTSEQCEIEQLNNKIKVLNETLQLKEMYIEKLILEKKKNPLKTENNKLQLLLSEEELNNNKYREEIAKLKNEISMRTAEMKKIPKTTADCDSKSVQTDQLCSDREELRKIRAKYEDLKRICRARNQRIKELEGVYGTEKENKMSNKQPEDEIYCNVPKHTEFLKMMDEYKKEIFVLQQKYGETKFICISRGEQILALESELDKLRK